MVAGFVMVATDRCLPAAAARDGQCKPLVHLGGPNAGLVCNPWISLEFCFAGCLAQPCLPLGASPQRAAGSGAAPKGCRRGRVEGI